MKAFLRAAVLAAGLCGCMAGAQAITLGQSDDFQGGTTAGWSSGAANPSPPVLVAAGGPGGAGDAYLLVPSTGVQGPGGKLVALSGAQWAGDYLAAGVSAITMDLANFGGTDLELHLFLVGSGTFGAVTLQGVPLPAGSGWTHVSFDLGAAALAGAPLETLAGVTQVRLFHANSAAFPGPNVAALLGVDNITAVPEPAPAALLAAGVLVLAWRRRSRRAAAALMVSCGMAAQAGTLLPPITHGDLQIGLVPVATGLAAPDYATFAPGDTSRLFVVEQNGLLRVIQNGSLLAAPALDISARVIPPLNPANFNDERGFLGLAFHPDFNRPGSAGFGTLYTYNSELIAAGTAPTYAAPNNAVQNYQNVVNEWKMSNGVVDPNSRREIISFGKNAGNHNGGTILFGNDGLLYLGLGDGGNANDVGPSHLEPGGNSQNLSTPLGKMLRIDPVNPALTAGSANPVSANGQYRIPSTNPFQGAGQAPEIYALGFRNPYRFAMDRPDLGGNGKIIVADVGQNSVEEIDRLQLGGNYGWAIKEGTFLFNRTTGPGGAAGTVGANSPGSPAGLIDPITGTQGTLQYDHGDGISITGGFVYRGGAMPWLFGKYVFGDLALRPAAGGQPRADGRLFYADLETGVIHEFLLPQFSGDQLPNGLTVHGFGEDAFGELYVLVTNSPANGTGGIVYMITAGVPEPATWASLDLGLLAVVLRVRRGPRAAALQEARRT